MFAAIAWTLPIAPNSGAPPSAAAVASDAGATPPPSQGPAAGLANEARLAELIDRTLDVTQNERELSLERNAAWQLMHGVLAFGRNFRARHNEELVPLLDWAMAGNPVAGWDLRPTDRGIRAEVDPGRHGQGHEDQWLSIMAQCQVTVNDPLVVAGKTYKVYDLLRRSLYDCYEGKETSWTVIALSNYLDPIDQTWMARDGETWSLGRLVGIEAGPAFDDRLAAQHVNDAACGGTHRLIALTMAANRFRRDFPDRKLEGPWLAAQQRVAWGIETAREYQLPTGAFSVHFFDRPANSASIDDHLAATGHTLEFLSMALSGDQIRAPWVQKSVIFLCDLLERTRHVDLECGALYHAAHGLVLYRQRLTSAQP